MNRAVFILGILQAILLLVINVSGAAMTTQQADSAIQQASSPAEPRQQPYSINFIGNTHFPEKDLLQAAAAELRMFEQRGYRKADIDDAAFQMRSAYLQAGFASAFVDYVYEADDTFIRVIFKVDEGPRVFVERIDFVGNDHVESETLLGLLPKTSRGWGRQQKPVFVESEIRDAVNKIRDYYRGEGFADVKVRKPTLAFNQERSGVEINIQVEEGPRYSINDVILQGDLIPGLEKIQNDFVGKSYYVRRKLQLRTRLDEAYDAVGYADAVLAIEAVKLGEPGKVNLLAEISSNEKVRIAEVVITGNNSTREAFIRGRVALKPGDIYTKAKRMESFGNLYDSGLFAKITIELTPPKEDSGRDLEVRVEELPTRDVYIEPGWGSYENLRLRVGFFEKNLFGTGRSWRIDGLVSTKGESVTIGYTDPWLLQTDITMNIPLVYERREEPSYTSRGTSLSVLLSKKLHRNLTLTTGYQFKQTQLLDLSDDTPLPTGEEDYNKGTIGIQTIWDTRDDIFYPAAGLRFASGFDISLPALGSDLEYGRITLGGRYFIKLPQEVILGLRATTGLIVPIRDQASIPISERFFNGGDSTVRSYKHSELGPKDEKNEPLGGLGYNVFSVELRKRFYRNSAVTLYVDAGNVSPNRSLLQKDYIQYTSRSELMDDTLNDFFSEFQYGIGVGYQYLLPVGPLRLDIAYNPDPVEVWNEDDWVFHFSFGMAF